MNKIKDIVLEKLKKATPTNAEATIFVVITRYQDDYGLVSGAYYKDVCEEASCSYPTFYSAIRGLEKKNIVKLIQRNGDWDILILENDFSQGIKSLKEGYLNMNHDVFFSKEFSKMTAVEKLLVMDLMRKCQKNSKNGSKYHILLENFYEQYGETFKGYGKSEKLSKRVLQMCMRTLRKFFYINISLKEYWVSPKQILYKQEKVENERTEEGNLKQHLSEVICRREKLEYTQDTLQDTINLLNTFRDSFKEKLVNPVDALLRAVKRSLEIKNKDLHNTKKWKRKLVPSLVNKVIYEEILGFSF